MLSEWISADKMSAAERQANFLWETTAGYLKVFDYKEAHRIWWAKLSVEDRAKITGLPNFDAAKFERITGINAEAPKGDGMAKLVLDKIVLLESELAKLKGELEENANG